MLVICSGLVAIAVPNMADLIAVVGAFSISTLSFVMPPLAYYRLCHSQMSALERVCVLSFFVVSIGVMFYTTYTATKTLIEHL